MNNQFYNLLNYYRSINIARKLTDQNLLTQKESQSILEKLKQYYKIQEIIDDSHMSNV